MTHSVQPEIDLILAYLQEQTGLNFFGNHLSMIKRRLQVRLSKTAHTSYEDYLEFLKQDNGELATRDGWYGCSPKGESW